MRYERSVTSLDGNLHFHLPYKLSSIEAGVCIFDIPFASCVLPFAFKLSSITNG